MPDRKLEYNDKVKINALMKCMDIEPDNFVAAVLFVESVNAIVRNILTNEAPTGKVRKLPPYSVGELYLIQTANKSVTEILKATNPDIADQFIGELARIGSAGMEAYSASLVASYYIMELIASATSEAIDAESFEEVFLEESVLSSDDLPGILPIDKAGSLTDAISARPSKEEAIEATKYHMDRLLAVVDETYALISEYPSVPRQKLLRAGYHNLVARISLLASRYHIADVMAWVLRNGREQDFAMLGFSTDKRLKPKIRFDGAEIFHFEPIETSVMLDALDYDTLLDKIGKYVVKPAKSGEFDVDRAVMHIGMYMMRGSSVTSAWTPRVAKMFASNDLAIGGKAGEMVRQMYRPYSVEKYFDSFVMSAFPYAANRQEARNEFLAHLLRETDCKCMKTTTDELIQAGSKPNEDKRYLGGTMSFIANIHREVR